jgi:hypothetical protein
MTNCKGEKKKNGIVEKWNIGIMAYFFYHYSIIPGFHDSKIEFGF